MELEDKMDHKDVMKAVNFAALKHTNQRRKDVQKTPYINHPIGVAYSVITEGNVYDVRIIQAALLHDTVEDTDTTYEELEREFGKKVRDIVEEVTDNKSITKDLRKRQQVEHALLLSKEAKTVKLADKLYNLRGLINGEMPSFWTADIAQGYFVWSKKVTDNLKGANPGLEKALDEIFKRSFKLDGKEYTALPQNVNLDEFLQQYYEKTKTLRD